MPKEKIKYVSFHEDKTELIISFLNKEVDFILRLNKGLKIRNRIKPIDMHVLRSITSVDFKKQKEQLYLKNARHTFLLSKNLHRRKEHRDAFLYLHLSLEHLIKYIWVKSRYAYQKKYLEDMPMPLDKDGKDPEYSHDISFSIQELIRQVSGLANETRIRDSLSPLANSKAHGGWADIRYSTNPGDPSIQHIFESYYRDLRTAVISLGVDLFNKEVLK